MDKVGVLLKTIRPQSTIMTIDSKGKVKETYSYDAFGNAYEGSFLRNNDIGYNGKMFDPAVGLLNYGFRDYAPNLGRFTTVDPIRDGGNWYAYCHNDPVNFVDPWGLVRYDDSGNTIDDSRILQTDSTINLNDNNMSNSGCRFRALQGIAETYIGTNLTADQINQAREDLLESGAIDDDMFVNNPSSVINDAFRRLGSFNTATHIGDQDEYLNYITESERITDATILEYETSTGSHYTEGDENANEVFDPAPSVIDTDTNRYLRFRINDNDSLIKRAARNTPCGA
jgi:RHS repeat-associated protein